MTRIKTLLLVCVAAAASAGCNKKQTPTEFASAEYKFKAKFPGQPKVDEQTTAGIKVKMFAVESRDGMLGVAVSDSPLGADPPEAVLQAGLDGARDGAVKNTGGTLKASSPVTLAGKYPGREFTATITQPKAGLFRARLYLVGPRLYQVMVLGTDSFVNSPDAAALLDSFQVTP